MVLSKETAARNVRWVLPATILGSSLSFIDGSVVNVALPAMQRDLRTDLTTMQWVVNGYMLTLASFILLGGSAGDHFGRRRVFLIGLVTFALASLACALSPSALWLVAARLTQGIAAAFMMPSSLALIGAAYSGDARGRAIGTWAAAGSLTSALGPPLGGWLVDHVGWRSIFFINLPIAATAVWLGLKLTHDRGMPRVNTLDFRGALLAIVTLAVISYGLIALGAGNRISGIVALAAAIPAAWLFILSQARAADPMMPLSLFRNRTFLGANILTVTLYAAMSAAMFLLPYLMIEAYGHSAAAAGAAFLPFPAIMGIGSRWTGSLVERLGARVPLMIGPTIVAGGFAILGLSAGSSTYWTGLLPGLIVVAIGMTLSVAPLTTTVFNAAPNDKSGTASGINNAAARTGGLLAVAALGLAFGGVNGAQGAAVTHAYRIVMFASALLAGLSAITAALTIDASKNAT
jgi:EmrB/QacA subfamily drug resistance transporter